MSQFCIVPGDKRCNRAAPRYPSRFTASCLSFTCTTCIKRFGVCRGEKDPGGNLCDGCWQKREDKRAKRAELNAQAHARTRPTYS